MIHFDCRSTVGHLKRFSALLIKPFTVSSYSLALLLIFSLSLSGAFYGQFVLVFAHTIFWYVRLKFIARKCFILHIAAQLLNIQLLGIVGHRLAFCGSCKTGLRLKRIRSSGKIMSGSDLKCHIFSAEKKNTITNTEAVFM